MRKKPPSHMPDLRTYKRPKSLIFSSAMVKSLLENRKTQTRQVIKLPKERDAWEATTIGGDGSRFSTGELAPQMPALWNTTTGTCLVCPLGRPGDHLWVRETWADLRGGGFDKPVAYLADSFRRGAEDAESKRCRLDFGIRWRPSIHMPRWASRLTLDITEVRVERLHDLSEGDAIAEGIAIATEGTITQEFGTAIRLYQKLWASLNAKRGFSWEKNPWVWVVSFRVLNEH